MVDRKEGDAVQPLDVSHFGGSETEMLAFVEQYFARLGPEKFAMLGRGVIVIRRPDSNVNQITGQYGWPEPDDERDEAHRARALMETYDPSLQAILVWVNSAGPDLVHLVDIDARH